MSLSQAREAWMVSWRWRISIDHGQCSVCWPFFSDTDARGKLFCKVCEVLNTSHVHVSNLATESYPFTIFTY